MCWHSEAAHNTSGLPHLRRVIYLVTFQRAMLPVALQSIFGEAQRAQRLGLGLGVMNYWRLLFTTLPSVAARRLDDGVASFIRVHGAFRAVSLD